MAEITEDSIMVVPDRRRPGRPRAPEPSNPVTTWLPVSTHDKLIQLAHKHDVSVSQIMRTIVILRLNTPGTLK